MGDKPTSAADPRPGGEPYYIDSGCPDCGAELVLYDEYREEEIEEVWHDEWICPECDGGILLDWPEEMED